MVRLSNQQYYITTSTWKYDSYKQEFYNTYLKKYARPNKAQRTLTKKEGLTAKPLLPEI